MFGFDAETGKVILFWMHIPLQDVFLYVGAVVGFIKNYYANMRIIDEQLASRNLKEQEMEEARKKARRDFIYQNSKTYYLRVQQVAKDSEMSGDDKLVLYLDKFIAGMQTMTGQEPSNEDIDSMKDKAFHHAIEDKQGKAQDSVAGKTEDTPAYIKAKSSGKKSVKKESRNAVSSKSKNKKLSK